MLTKYLMMNLLQDKFVIQKFTWIIVWIIVWIKVFNVHPFNNILSTKRGPAETMESELKIPRREDCKMENQVTATTMAYNYNKANSLGANVKILPYLGNNK